MSSQDSNRATFFWKTFFIGLFIMLVVGVVVGYGIRGRKNEKPNVKQLLSGIAHHIESIENESANLKDQIKEMKSTVEKGKKAIQSVESMKGNLTKLRDENKGLSGQMKNYLQLQQKIKELDNLKKENKKLKASLGEKAKLAERVRSLKKENEELRLRLEKVKDVIRQPDPSFKIDQPSS